MQLYQLKPQHQRRHHKRVGRGGKKGTYSGRGVKGQQARAGYRKKPGFAGGDTTFLKRLPKQRGSVGGIKIRKGVKPASLPLVIFNLRDLDRHFKTNEIISPLTLLKKGLIKRIKGRLPKIKILGSGGTKKKFVFQGVKTSRSVEEKMKGVSKKLKSKIKNPKPQ